MPRLGRWGWEHLLSFLRAPQRVLLFGAFTGFVWLLWSYTQHAEAFRITSIQLPQTASLRLRQSLIGTSLWDLDLQGLADELHQQQPWLKEVRVIRQLPNTLRIEPIERRPVAQVKLEGWCPVDRDGFVLPPSLNRNPESLVRVVGVERGGTPVRVGKDNRTHELLQLALRLLDKLRRAPALVSYQLIEIQVADPRAIRFLIARQGGAEPIEVRCGSEAELDMQLKRLRTALTVVARRALAVEYIDVRFPEPVLGPRT